jgi:hypothetical protein
MGRWVRGNLLFEFKTMSTYDVESIGMKGTKEKLTGLTSGGSSVAVASASQMIPLRKKMNISELNFKEPR